uniref:tRNA modification GTPase MnmE n=1 Tax=Lygus hesperus TaxID=30085 RepID=A0A0A9ZH39_LYGHE
MLKDNQCTGENCRTCKVHKTDRKPVVRDCWYDVPYVWLEVVLRLLTLMGILVILFIVIHLTIGQLSTLKSFTTFLEHSHLITDASELGILGNKPSKEEGLYSPQDIKDDTDLKGVPSPRARNTTKLWDLPVEIYKGIDDDNAYFITFREICDENALADGQKLEESGMKATPASKTSFNLVLDGSKDQAVPNLQGFYGQNHQSSSHSFVERSMLVGNSKIESSQSQSGADISADQQNADLKLAVGNVDMRNSNPAEFNERLKLNKLSTMVDVAKSPGDSADSSKLKISNNDLSSFENFIRMRENKDAKANQNTHSSSVNLNQQLSVPRSETMDKNREAESVNEVTNEVQFPAKPIPKLKLVLNEHPQSVLEMKIDLNAIKPKELAPLKGVNDVGKVDKLDDGEPDGISVEEEDLEAANADEAKRYLKDKIARQIQKKENEIMERLENRPRMKGVMEVESDTADIGNFSFGSLLGRKARGIEAIDKSITYTEHERSMKQEVEVTYRRAQDIAKAILKTSEAIANSLDLCRKPISTNFISDEPLTEAEDVIDQIVGQLKESLELTMGCRTCVKPHKDLMLFLRWLIFDDVSVKLCPSKPKAADLRKNYLLFNHDNMFLGRVCGQGEHPRAPYNCSNTGEVQKETEEENKPDEPKVGPRKGVVSKKRLRTNNNG